MTLGARAAGTLSGPAAPIAVIVPTHDHAATLPRSVGSVTEQSLSDLDIVVVGDGVGDDTRDVVADLRRGDPRIRFIDRPKSGRTGEPTRNEVLAALRSPLVAYHGDDDLMFADHLQTMVELIDSHDFAHPLPVYVEPGDRLRIGHFDASQPRWRDSISPPISRNVVSLTGVMHTMESYRWLPFGWRVSPPGMRTDQYMWQQYFALPGFRGVTGGRATTVKLAAVLRGDQSGAQRQAESERWARLVADPEFRPAWDREVERQVRLARPRGVAMGALVRSVRPGGPDWWIDAQRWALDLGRATVPWIRTFSRPSGGG